MWSRICTTWPENPHCGNCGVPFMNSTTSLAFTSLSMNCSMPMDFRPVRRCRAVPVADSKNRLSAIYVAQNPLPPQVLGIRITGVLSGGVERALHLDTVVLIEAGDFHNGARGIGA